MDNNNNDNGTIVFDTPHGISYFQLCTLKSALKLELKGIKMFSGKTSYSTLKQMGFKGSRQSVLDQVQYVCSSMLEEKQNS